ncbi:MULTISPECIES: GNAT family N-acetyltransferase [Paenibacillus]|uniref:GNAT family N-acetyltransferase n=1 Tax=Paenibacillus TaxID=44249 RepID=UPI002FE08850
MLVQVTSFPAGEALQELMEYATGFDSDRERQAWDLYASAGQAELYGYEEEGEWIGLIGFAFREGAQMEILHLAVHPEDRLKGYGRGIILETLLLKQPRVITAVTDEEGADFFRNIGFSVQDYVSQSGYEEFRCVYRSEEEESDE